jgi:hypothetical protein
LKEKWTKFFKNEYVTFALKTVFYFAVLFALVYLYSYSGVNQPHFIYNEFRSDLFVRKFNQSDRSLGDRNAN